MSVVEKLLAGKEAGQWYSSLQMESKSGSPKQAAVVQGCSGNVDFLWNCRKKYYHPLLSTDVPVCNLFLRDCPFLNFSEVTYKLDILDVAGEKSEGERGKGNLLVFMFQRGLILLYL